MTLFHEAVGHQNYLSCLAFSPNGEWLLSGSRDGTAKLWNVASGQLLRTFWWGAEDINAVAWSPDGMTVGISGSPPPKKLSVERFDLIQAFHRGELTYEDLPEEPDDGRRSQLRLFRASDGELLKIFDDAGEGVAFAPDGQNLTAIHWDNLSIIDLQSGTRRISKEHLHLCEPCYSLDGSLVACVGECGIYVFDATTAELVRIAHDPHLFDVPNPADDHGPISTLPGPPVDVPPEELLGHILRFWQELLPEFRPCSFFGDSRDYRIAFSRDGRWAALKPSVQQMVLMNWYAGNHFCQLVLVDAVTRTVRAFVRDHKLRILSTAAYSPDGRFLAWGGSEQSINLLSVSDGQAFWPLDDSPPAVTALCLSPNQPHAAAGTSDGRLLVCDWKQMDVLAMVPVFDQPLEHVEYSPDGKWLLMASRAGMVRLLEVSLLKTLCEFSAHRARFLGGSFTADGSQFISLGYDEVPTHRDVTGKNAHLIRWSLPDGSPLESIELPDGYRVNSAAAAPDRSRLAISSRDEVLVAEIGENFSYHSVFRREETGLVTFLPDSTRLLVTGEVCRIQILDLNTGHIDKSFMAIADGPSSHAFNSSGELLVRSTCYRSMLELFDVTTGKYMRQFFGHLNSVNVVAFTPDDARIVSAGQDGTLKFWDAASGELLASIVVFSEPDTAGRQWECLKSLKHDAFR